MKTNKVYLQTQEETRKRAVTENAEVSVCSVSGKRDVDGDWEKADGLSSEETAKAFEKTVSMK